MEDAVLGEPAHARGAAGARARTASRSIRPSSGSVPEWLATSRQRPSAGMRSTPCTSTRKYFVVEQLEEGQDLAARRPGRSRTRRPPRSGCAAHAAPLAQVEVGREQLARGVETVASAEAVRRGGEAARSCARRQRRRGPLRVALACVGRRSCGRGAPRARGCGAATSAIATARSAARAAWGGGRWAGRAADDGRRRRRLLRGRRRAARRAASLRVSGLLSGRRFCVRHAGALREQLHVAQALRARRSRGSASRVVYAGP